jgi:hypothetical protein
VSGRPDSAFVFNVVWTGTTFRYLQYFVSSLLANSGSRFRFVANGCSPESITMMEAFAAERPDRVLDVLEVSSEMVAHGVALDATIRATDDGEFFCLIDPDIKANRPFVAHFSALLADHDAVTSGREVWTDDNVVPEGHRGVGGRHFYDREGFVFGSPHLALYRRAALDDTMARWGVGFGSAGPDLSDQAKAALAAFGHDYAMYDTGKIVNILLQADGHRLVHSEHPDLIHIGGMSHYLSPPSWVQHEGEVEPDWVKYPGMTSRFEVARFTARMLRALSDGQAAPDLPGGLEPDMEARLSLVRTEMIDLLERHGAASVPPQAR